MNEISAEHMKSMDKYTIEKIGIPSIVLMENAAKGVVKNMNLNFKNQVFLCSVGNNGADGLASARIFSNLSHSKKYDVYIFIIGDEENGSIEFKTQLNILKNLDIKTVNLTENNFDVFKKIINKDCCIIDALFGIGLKRNIGGIYKRAIEVVNEKAGFRISVDVPSGIDANTGEVRGIAVKSDRIVTFHKIKTGIKNLKDIRAVDIGIPLKVDKLILEGEDLLKSQRNKTIDIGFEDGKVYFDKLIDASKTDDFNIENKIILGDSLKVMDKLPRNFVDLLIVDPPYNLSKNYNGYKFNQISDEEYEKYTINWINKAIPLLKENASVYVCCDWNSGIIIGKILSEHLILRNRITWEREKGRGAMKNWKNSSEDIYFATKSDKYTFNLNSVKIRRRVLAPYREKGRPKDWRETSDGKFRDSCPSNFWGDITVPFWSMSENTAHPTQKSEKLMAKLILASSNEGDIVFDPFAGSGSSLVVAKKLGRKFLGVERNSLYGIWAQKRLENASDNKKIQGFEKGVFFERNTNIKR